LYKFENGAAAVAANLKKKQFGQSVFFSSLKMARPPSLLEPSPPGKEQITGEHPDH
jgi:hypothetical protein